MISAQVAVYRGEAPIADWTPRMTAGRLSFGSHGAESLVVRVPMAASDAARWVDRALEGLGLRVNIGGLAVWRGRLEDVDFTLDGIEATGLGEWANLLDVPYTAFWISSDYGRWRVSTIDDKSNRKSELFEIATDGAFYFAPRSGEDFGDTEVAGVTIETPDDSSRAFARVTYDWEIDAGSVWRLQLRSYPRDFSGTGTIELSHPGTGMGLLSGSSTATLTGGDHRLEFVMYRDSATPATFSLATGSTYAKVTNVTVSTIANSQVLTTDIIGDALSDLDAVNAGRVKTSTLFVGSGHDMKEIVIEDQLVGDVVDMIASLSDSAGARKEVGINREGYVYLRTRGAQRVWYADIDEPALAQSLDKMINAAYAVYRDERGHTRRSAIVVDGDSVNRYGLTRRIAVDADGSNETIASNSAKAQLAGFPEPAASLRVSRLYTNLQAIEPSPYRLQVGDTIRPRNLPAFLPPGVARYLGSFVVARIEIDMMTGELRIEPEVAAPTLAGEVIRIQKDTRRDVKRDVKRARVGLGR